jgi:hypothetical protein
METTLIHAGVALALIAVLILALVALAFKHSTAFDALVAAHASVVDKLLTAIVGPASAAGSAAALTAPLQTKQVLPVAASSSAPAAGGTPAGAAPAASPAPAGASAAALASLAAFVGPGPTVTIAGKTYTQAQYAAANTPQAASYSVVEPAAGKGTTPVPADYQNLNATTVVDLGDGVHYLDNTGNVCHFSLQSNGQTVKVLGY